MQLCPRYVHPSSRVHYSSFFDLIRQENPSDWLVQEVAFAFEMDQEGFQMIVSKAVQAFKASEAAKKARDLIRTKNILTNSTLPGKNEAYQDYL